jgi:hypothetical protein
MVTREDIESFLIRAGADAQEIEENIWLVLPAPPSEEGEEGNESAEPGIVINFAPPVVVFRALIRKTPDDEQAQLGLYRRLLELNATDLVHGAYGLEDGEIVLGDTRELENLDFSEFRASLESLAMALTSHYSELTTD